MTIPSGPPVRYPAKDSLSARIEDLEEALRLIVTVLQPDRQHEVDDRSWAALAVAYDALGLDQEFLWWLASTPLAHPAPVVSCPVPGPVTESA